VGDASTGLAVRVEQLTLTPAQFGPLAASAGAPEAFNSFVDAVHLGLGQAGVAIDGLARATNTAADAADGTNHDSAVAISGAVVPVGSNNGGS
jgi:hypothetical protein